MSEVDHKLISGQIEALAEASPWWVPVLSNASAVINESMDDINWVGFYIVRGDELILGPFQGRVACIRIAKGKGVCGTAFEKDEAQLVTDVHEFPGHIACDAASNSEVVIPIHNEGRVVAVLDIDSPSKARFTEKDRDGLCEIAKTIEKVIEW